MASIPDGLNFNDLLDKEDVDEIFTLEEEIAAGSFGTVYKGTHVPTGKTMAIKIITPDEDEIPEDLMIEIAFLKQVNHPNIIKYYGGYRKGDEIFIAMELCSCCARDIFEYTEDPLLESEIALIMYESLKGLEYMHQNNYIHRDIKAANILIGEDATVKLIDFGVSSLNAKKAKTFVGTPYWMAPEVIDSKNGLSTYDEKIDIWSIGITCIELAETIPPLSYINPMRALFQIPVRESPTLEKKEKWSATFHDFIAQCLEKNPKKRPNATELLKHPFVANCDKSPQVMLDLIKRKNKLENCYESDDEDSDEDMFVETSDLAASLGFDASDALFPEKPSPSPLVQETTPLDHAKSTSTLTDPMQELAAIGQFGAAQSTPNFLSSPPPKPPDTPAPVPPTDLQKMANSLDKPAASSTPAISTGSRPNSANTPKAQQPQAGFSPANRAKMATKGRTNRPTNTTHKQTNRHKDLYQRGNKRVIKQQMAYLRELNVKLHKRVQKQEKKQQQEKDAVVEAYKKQLDQLAKTSDSQKKALERQQKVDQDGLLKAQKGQRKQLLRENEAQDRAVQKEIREEAKSSNKRHELKQKERLRESKLLLKQSKKTRSKSDLKLLEKEQKVEVQLYDKLHQAELARNQMFKEKEIEWQHHIAYNNLDTTELSQQQQQAREMLAQICGHETESLNQQYNLKMEEQLKIHPMEQRHQREAFELQQQNLKQQLLVERENQLKLLAVDQKLAEKKHRNDKKNATKQNETELKQALKSSSKSEIKERRQQFKDKLAKGLTEMDLKFKSTIEEQRLDEEASIDMFQNRVFQQLKERQEEQREELEKAHAVQQAELQHEEVQARTVLTNDHHQKELALTDAQHSEIKAQVEKQHNDKLTLLRTQQQQVMDAIGAQKTELLNFVSANQARMLPGSPQSMNDRIERIFLEVTEERQALHYKSQSDLSTELEREIRTLNQRVFDEKQAMEEKHSQERSRLEQLAQTSTV